jgi:hypothetical protein
MPSYRAESRRSFYLALTASVIDALKAARDREQLAILMDDVSREIIRTGRDV